MDRLNVLVDCKNEMPARLRGRLLSIDDVLKFNNELLQPDCQTTISFVDYLCSFNFHALELILHESGSFDISFNNDLLSIKTVGKTEYLQWIEQVITKHRYYDDTPLTFQYDRCWGCSLGGNVVMFNGGKFPIETQAANDIDKIGILLESKEGKINRIAYCQQMQYVRNSKNCDKGKGHFKGSNAY